MSRYSSHDEYTDPATGVLKNRLGITDKATLETTEAQFVAARARELTHQPIPGVFDLPHLQAIHRHLFGDLYEWAGHVRTVDLIKGTSRFAHHAHLERAAAPIFRGLAQEKYLRGLEPDAWSGRAAHYLAELNALHPFRDGNGRALRAFFSQVSHDSGYTILWKNMTQSGPAGGVAAVFLRRPGPADDPDSAQSVSRCSPPGSDCQYRRQASHAIRTATLSAE